MEHQGPRTYRTLARDRQHIVDFIVDALLQCGCRLIYTPSPSEAPFRFTFETPEGERLGIIAYAFTANKRGTRNRPTDEHRFQIKYGSDDKQPHEIWQDPFGLYTTLLVGVNSELGMFVGADPVLHNPTRFFASLEYKDRDADAVLSKGWHTWSRAKRVTKAAFLDPNAVLVDEVLVGGVPKQFLQYVRFERAAIGEDQGHRQLIAERASSLAPTQRTGAGAEAPEVEQGHLHALAREFQLSETQVLDLIAGNMRTKMNVRGAVAELHLVTTLTSVPGVTECRRLNDDRRPDIELRYRGSRPLTIECKNVARDRTADGSAKLDFQRTRASKSDPCSRYYSPADFDVVAACLHAISEQWEFRFARPDSLDAHKSCEGKLATNVRINDNWVEDAASVLAQAAAAPRSFASHT